MKNLNQYIKEKLIINKDYHDNVIVVKSFDELRKIIEDRYYELGPGTEQDPINFNDIDVSNINSFFNYDKNIGIFERTKFKYIDISDWDISNVKSMRSMFFECEELESVGDLSSWDVLNVTDMSFMFENCRRFNTDLSSFDVSNITNMKYMFFGCENFNQNISGWNVSSVENMQSMFFECKKFNQNLSSWDVSNVIDMAYMFSWCKNFNQDLSSWDISNVIYKDSIFDNCPIKDEYKPKFK